MILLNGHAQSTYEACIKQTHDQELYLGGVAGGFPDRQYFL